MRSWREAKRSLLQRVAALFSDANERVRAARATERERNLRAQIAAELLEQVSFLRIHLNLLHLFFTPFV